MTLAVRTGRFWSNLAPITAVLILSNLVLGNEEALSARTPSDLVKLVTSFVDRELSARSIDSIKIGTFENIGFSGDDSGIALNVEQSLVKEGYSHSPNAGATLTGKIFRVPEFRSHALSGMRVRVELTIGSDEKTMEVLLTQSQGHALRRGVEGASEFMLPPVAELDREIIEKRPVVKKVQVATIGESKMDLAFASKDSPYGVGLRVRKEGEGEFRPKSLRIVPGVEPGMPAVVSAGLQIGDTYELVILNNTRHAHAIETMIDGMSRYSVSESESDRSCLDIVKANSPRILKGWYKNDKNNSAFVVGRLDGSVASRTSNSPKRTGAIAISFRAAWRDGEEIPEFEVSGDAATHEGEDREDPVVSVPYHVGGTRAVIVLVYGESDFKR